MNARTAAATVAVLALALSGCAGGDDTPEPKPSASSSAASTVDQAAEETACKEAWRQALEDGSIDAGSVSGENHPAACEGVTRSAKLGLEAIREHNAANRERLEACTEDSSDPSCEGVPVP